MNNDFMLSICFLGVLKNFVEFDENLKNILIDEIQEFFTTDDEDELVVLDRDCVVRLVKKYISENLYIIEASFVEEE